jgi:hypothetical protein
MMGRTERLGEIILNIVIEGITKAIIDDDVSFDEVKTVLSRENVIMFPNSSTISILEEIWRGRMKYSIEHIADRELFQDLRSLNLRDWTDFDNEVIRRVNPSMTGAEIEGVIRTVADEWANKEEVE